MVMHRGFTFLMVGLVGLVVAPFPQVPASASCTGPYLEGAERLVLRRGVSTSVEGRSFADGCRDTMTCSGVLGCQECTYDEPPERPQQDIRLELRQRGQTWALATADARSAEDQRLGWVTWTFELPNAVRPGPARLVPEGAQPVEVRVR
jgi:hypothetical protein